jgi:hypothetical protein
MKTYEEPDENSLSYAQSFKKHSLRFDIGEVVYLKSDLKRKCPMTICLFEINETKWDYQVEWMNSQNKREYASFLDKVLTQ